MISVVSADQIVDDHVTAGYVNAAAAMTDYVRLCAARVLQSTGLWSLPRVVADPEPIASRLGIAAAAFPAFCWLLAEAAAGGSVRDRGATGRRTAYVPGPAPDRAYAASIEEALDGASEWVGCGRAMVDFVTDRYPAFLTGRVSGPGLLLKGRGRALWDTYFTAAHPLYDVHNKIAVEALGSVGYRSGRPDVLELGSGTGGASAALMRSLPAGANLTVSDISPVFRKQALARAAGGVCGVRERPFDFNKTPEEQGFESGTFDAVVAVNALHNAEDLSRALTSVRRLLRAGGHLVISESVRAAGARLHQEFIFNLLTRTGRSPFLPAQRWRRELGAIEGATPCVAVNRVGPEMAMLAIACA